MTVVATWNVNSIRARLPRVLEWLEEFKPDVSLFQEIKATEENFPRLEIEGLGYNIEIYGQKNFNGVAILSKTPIVSVQRGLPNYPEDMQARYIEGITSGIRVASIYLPNGNPAPGEKYEYKLSWMEALFEHMQSLIKTNEKIIRNASYR